MQPQACSGRNDGGKDWSLDTYLFIIERSEFGKFRRISVSTEQGGDEMTIFLFRSAHQGKASGGSAG